MFNHGRLFNALEGIVEPEHVLNGLRLRLWVSARTDKNPLGTRPFCGTVNGVTRRCQAGETGSFAPSAAMLGKADMIIITAEDRELRSERARVRRRSGGYSLLLVMFLVGVGFLLMTGIMR